MNYPIRILPNKTYKSIECDLSSHYLIRFTSTKDITKIRDPETGFIKQDHICQPRKRASDLSTSLLGVFVINSSNSKRVTETVVWN